MPLDQKLVMRQQFLAKRLSLSPEYIQKVSDEITERIKLLTLWHHRQLVHVYLPIGGDKNELSTWKLVDWLLSSGHQVWTSYLPEDCTKDGYCQIDRSTAYEQGRYGIPLPKEPVLKSVSPTAIVIPCLATDTKGNRMGYGSGWYDWFLEQHQAALRIGLVYDELLFDDIPNEPKDQPLDIIVSQKQVIKIPGRKL